MKLVQYNKYLVSTVDADGLVLQHSAECAHMCFQLLLGLRNIKIGSHLISLIDIEMSQVSEIHSLKEDKNIFVSHSQFHFCCWPGDIRSQGIRSHDIDLFWSNDGGLVFFNNVEIPLLLYVISQVFLKISSIVYSLIPDLQWCDIFRD